MAVDTLEWESLSATHRTVFGKPTFIFTAIVVIQHKHVEDSKGSSET